MIPVYTRLSCGRAAAIMTLDPDDRDAAAAPIASPVHASGEGGSPGPSRTSVCLFSGTFAYATLHSRCAATGSARLGSRLAAPWGELSSNVSAIGMSPRRRALSGPSSSCGIRRAHWAGIPVCRFGREQESGAGAAYCRILESPARGFLPETRSDVQSAVA